MEDGVNGLVDLHCLSLLPLGLHLLLLFLLNLIFDYNLADDSPVFLAIEPRNAFLPQILEQIDPLPVKLLTSEELVIGAVVEVIGELVEGKVAF